ncbi:MAG TPA: hypothetical protein VFB72_02280 [Verrucomicrobiae bacterium]|nr:hypothetical protein [Verrucomicrobiae bacterium]
MKISPFFSTGLAAAIVLLLFVAVSSDAHASGAAKDSKKSAAAASKTNMLPDELPIPESVFDVTVNPTKDPFFPLSTRRAISQIATNAPPTITAASFILKGVDWSEHHALALVNNRTLAAGEDAEVTTASGSKVRIHCLEIRPTSVVLRIPSQSDPLEISLRKSVQ